MHSGFVSERWETPAGLWSRPPTEPEELRRAGEVRDEGDGTKRAMGRSSWMRGGGGGI